MIGLILSYLTALKFWVGVAVGASIGAPVLKEWWSVVRSWIAARV